MRSPAVAIAWELYRPQRWGLAAVGAGLLVLSLVFHLLPATVAARVGEPLSTSLFFFALCYVYTIFLYSQPGQGGRRAGFPRRLFTLPVRTSVLVGLPMLYGLAAVILLWAATHWLVWQPCGMWQEPGFAAVAWLPLLLAAGLACLQALSWTLVRSPVLRVVAAVGVLPALALTIAYLFTFNPALKNLVQTYGLTLGDVVMVLSVAAIVLSYGLAVAGVARDRRGGGTGWPALRHAGAAALRWLSRHPAGQAAPGRTKSAAPFGSAPGAQFWFEWRRKGLILPLFVACFLAFFLGVVGPQLAIDLGDMMRILAALAVLPILVAFFVGYGLGKESFWAAELGLSPFALTRPLSSGALAAAKLQAAALSTLVAWVLIVLGGPLLVVVLSHGRTMTELLRSQVTQGGWAEVWGSLGLALGGAVGLTWTLLAAGLTGSLTGRAWVVNGMILTYLGALAGLGVGFGFLSHNPSYAEAVVTILTWLAGLAVLAKAAAAGWVLRLSRGPCRHGGTVVMALGIWLLGAGSLVALAVWRLPAEGIVVPLADRAALRVPMLLIVMGIALVFPLVRVLAAPLAVAWHRHR